MTREQRSSYWSLVAISTLALSACGSGGDSASEGSEESGDQITLTVATFNEFGLENLYKQYMEENPNIKIVERRPRPPTRRATT